MSIKLMISLLSKGNDGEQILKILDEIIEDSLDQQTNLDEIMF